MPLRLAFERDVLISRRCVAVAINHKVDGNQFFFALDLECYGGVGGCSPCSVHIRHRKGLLSGIRQSVRFAIRFRIAIEKFNVFFGLDGDGAGISGGIIAGHFTDCERAGAYFPRQIAMAGDTFNRYRRPSNFICGRGGLLGRGSALDREGNGGIDSPLTLYVLQRKSLGVVTGQGVLAIVQVVPRHIFVSSDGNVAGVAVSFVAGDIADVVCSLDQREACGGVRLGLRGAGHFHGRFQLGQIFSTGLCGRADNREGHGGISHRPPYIIVRIPGQDKESLGITGNGVFYTNRAIVCFDILCRPNGDGAGGHIAGHVDAAKLARACNHAIFFGIMDVSVAYNPYKLLNIFQIALTGSGGFYGLQAAQNMVLRGSIRRSPFSVAPYQIDFCPILTRHAVVGNVRSRRDANSGVELVHVGAEAIDDDLTAVIALINGERAVDQTEGLAAMADLRVGADNLYRIFAQQSLDGVIVGGSGLGGSVLLPHGVQRSGPGVAILDNIIALLGYGTQRATGVDRIRSILGLPALKDIAFPGGNGILHCKGVVSDSCICCRPRISTGRAGAAIGIIVQRVCIFRGGVGVLRYEIDRSALIAGGRTALVKLPYCGICLGFFRPTDDRVAAVNSSALCGGLNVRNRNRVVVIRGIGVIRGILANKLGLFGRTVIVANAEFVTHIQDGEGDIDLVAGVQSGGSWIGSGNRRHGHSFFLPLGGICDIRSHGSRNGGIPAGEGIAFPFGSAIESGGRGTGRQVAVNLIGKYCAVYTVSVCNGERFRVFRRRGVGLLLALVHYDGLGLGFVSPRRILFCQRSRGQKGEDHEQCQKQTENSAQTMVFILKYSPFIWRSMPEAQTVCTVTPSLPLCLNYTQYHAKSQWKKTSFFCN